MSAHLIFFDPTLSFFLSLGTSFKTIAMKFFIDTANLDDIREAHELGILDGVTTNPSLMAKEGISGQDNIYKHYQAIAEIVEGDVSAEVIATDYENMVEEGRRLADLAPNIVVKIPMIVDGVKALSTLTELGINTTCTLVFSPAQALSLIPISEPTRPN